jgi:hypothetical protein
MSRPRGFENLAGRAELGIPILFAKHKFSREEVLRCERAVLEGASFDRTDFRGGKFIRTGDVSWVRDLDTRKRPKGHPK